MCIWSTYGSQSAEEVSYLDVVAPKILVLNDDIMDIWQFGNLHSSNKLTSNLESVKA